VLEVNFYFVQGKNFGY
jgi:hypothetical protein